MGPTASVRLENAATTKHVHGTLHTRAPACPTRCTRPTPYSFLSRGRLQRIIQKSKCEKIDHTRCGEHNLNSEICDHLVRLQGEKALKANFFQHKNKGHRYSRASNKFLAVTGHWTTTMRYLFISAKRMYNSNALPSATWRCVASCLEPQNLKERSPGPYPRRPQFYLL